MLAMGLPLYLLFEVALIVSRVLEKKELERESQTPSGHE
jgi:Sec-independent protein secretion pathway component TatC